MFKGSVQKKNDDTKKKNVNSSSIFRTYPYGLKPIQHWMLAAHCDFQKKKIICVVIKFKTTVIIRDAFEHLKKYFDLLKRRNIYSCRYYDCRYSVLNYTQIIGWEYVGGLKNSLCVLNSQLERHNSSSVRNTTIFLMLVGRPVDAVTITTSHDVGRKFASSFSISCRLLIASVACLNCRV